MSSRLVSLGLTEGGPPELASTDPPPSETSAASPAPWQAGLLRVASALDATAVALEDIGNQYRFVPFGSDVFAPLSVALPDTLVVRCPPSRGVMTGTCYVEDAATGQFYGLVQEVSLQPVTKHRAEKA